MTSVNNNTSYFCITDLTVKLSKVTSETDSAEVPKFFLSWCWSRRFTSYVLSLSSAKSL